MTDLSQFPEEVRSKIEDLDRRIEGARAEEEDHQRSLSRLQSDLSQSTALRKAIVETAEACLPHSVPIGIWAQPEDKWGMPAPVTAGLQLPVGSDFEARRKRRDIRGEVLAYVKATVQTSIRKTTALEIAQSIGVPISSVEKALAVHERNGKLVEKPEGLWSLTGDVPAPKPAPPVDHVLNFIRRAGDMGVNDDQLKMIGATGITMTLLDSCDTIAQGEDGRWRAVAETEERAS